MSNETLPTPDSQPDQDQEEMISLSMVEAYFDTVQEKATFEGLLNFNAWLLSKERD